MVGEGASVRAHGDSMDEQLGTNSSSTDLFCLRFPILEIFTLLRHLASQLGVVLQPTTNRHLHDAAFHQDGSKEHCAPNTDLCSFSALWQLNALNISP